ncbi:sterol uptake control protein 2 [Fusarium flagelliforme]|uniref:Sterol uptake control protein 2 n=1 Tax=Fusarium flagelliforme TaxID=2675880 RepID=A0A395M6Y8_9HYPO|nr:sterol uptake control protein 2 [Fusarium flagelliforme]
MTSASLERIQRSALRRGPGRPRKDWAALASNSTGTWTLKSFSTSSGPLTSLEDQPSTNNACSLSVSDAELMAHYVHCTATTLSESDSADSGMVMFWKHNVLKIGFSHQYVLRLVYALAAFHLAYSHGKEPKHRAKYLSVAKSHSEIGLRQLNEALSDITESNCSALYVSALLVSYCSFAAGPKSVNDLMVCEVGSEAAYYQLPLIHGVRLIRRAIEPATLFTGYLAPLVESTPERKTLESPHLHINWVDPVEKLREWIGSSSDSHTTTFKQAVLSLSAVYEANYGNKDGSYGLVFGWLYRLQDAFLISLKDKQPLALLILSYFVPLLKTIRPCWLLVNWPEHILKSIRGMLSEEHQKWLEWPEQIVTQLDYQASQLA